MIVTSYSEARAKLASLMDKAVEDAEEIRITRRGKPDVVLISADELDSWKETVYLLRSPANAERLLQALEDARTGRNLVSISPGTGQPSGAKSMRWETSRAGLRRPSNESFARASHRLR